jgi:hypothetical protein
MTIPVVLSFEVWLPATMTWAYNQVRFTGGVEATVVADRTEAPQRFPGRTHVERKFDVRTCGRRLVGCYAELVNGTAAAPDADPVTSQP